MKIRKTFFFHSLSHYFYTWLDQFFQELRFIFFLLVLIHSCSFTNSHPNRGLERERERDWWLNTIQKLRTIIVSIVFTHVSWWLVRSSSCCWCSDGDRRGVVTVISVVQWGWSPRYSDGDLRGVVTVIVVVSKSERSNRVLVCEEEREGEIEKGSEQEQRVLLFFFSFLPSSSLSYLLLLPLLLSYLLLLSSLLLMSRLQTWKVVEWERERRHGCRLMREKDQMIL